MCIVDTHVYDHVVDARCMTGDSPRFPAQDWSCDVSELLAAEEDEQPKVAMRRLVLEPWYRNTPGGARWLLNVGVW